MVRYAKPSPKARFSTKNTALSTNHRQPPTSASWMNAVEGFFSKLARQRLKNAVLDSLDECVEAIDGYIEHHNADDARPFRWSRKPEDLADAWKRGYYQKLEQVKSNVKTRALVTKSLRKKIYTPAQPTDYERAQNLSGIAEIMRTKYPFTHTLTHANS